MFRPVAAEYHIEYRCHLRPTWRPVTLENGQLLFVASLESARELARETAGKARSGRARIVDADGRVTEEFQR